MALQHVTIASGQTVSSAFTIARAERPLALGIMNHAARVWRIEFALMPQGPFLPLLQNDGSGAVFNVMSLGTPGVCVVGPCPSATARLAVNSALVSTTSVAVADLGAGA